MTDTSPTAPLDLDALAALEQAATPGPWAVDSADLVVAAWANADEQIAEAWKTPDAAVIVALRNAARALIAAARDRDHERTEEALVRLRLRERAVDAEAERDAAQAEVAEVAVLADWKAQALPVIAGLQELGRALGVPLGKSITARESVDLALDLRNRAAAARAEVAALRAAAEPFLDVTRCTTPDYEAMQDRLRAAFATDEEASDDLNSREHKAATWDRLMGGDQ